MERISVKLKFKNSNVCFNGMSISSNYKNGEIIYHNKCKYIIVNTEHEVIDIGHSVINLIVDLYHSVDELYNDSVLYENFLKLYPTNVVLQVLSNSTYLIEYNQDIIKKYIMDSKILEKNVEFFLNLSPYIHDLTDIYYHLYNELKIYDNYKLNDNIVRLPSKDIKKLMIDHPVINKFMSTTTKEKLNTIL